MKMRRSYAVVTGASSGIGREFARRLAEEGYPLVLAARRQERLEELAGELRSRGTECCLVSADLSEREGCDRLLEQLEDKRVGVFINNAGFGDCGCFLETELEKELNMIDLNVKMLHYLTKRILRKMEAQGYGYLLNVASSAGLLPAGPYMATYYAGKAYVASLTQAIARELKERGSRVYVGALCPGPVDTEFNTVANVRFALPGIGAEECVDCALRQMKKRKTVIIPTLIMKAATTFSRFLPREMCVRIAGMQQKRKLQGKI